MTVDHDAPPEQVIPVGFPEWMSVKQVADATGLHRKMIYEAMTQGELPGTQHRRRGSWKIHRLDFETWQATRRARAEARCGLLSPRQVQRVTGYGRTFVYEALQTGALPAVKDMAGRWWVDPSAMDAWMRVLPRPHQPT